MTNVREIDCSSAPACLGSVLLHRPDAHPLWHSYQVSVVHLRPMVGVRDAAYTGPGATHEIQIIALDPESTPDPSDPSTLKRLSPPNLVYQLRARSDGGARDVFRAFVAELSSGALSPDTDRRSAQIAWLDRWDEAS